MTLKIILFYFKKLNKLLKQPCNEPMSRIRIRICKPDLFAHSSHSNMFCLHSHASCSFVFTQVYLRKILRSPNIELL